MCVSVCECASVSVCVQFDAWAAKTKTNIGIFCLEIWILAWRSHGKIMELFSEIFVGTLCCDYNHMLTPHLHEITTDKNAICHSWPCKQNLFDTVPSPRYLKAHLTDVIIMMCQLMEDPDLSLTLTPWNFGQPSAKKMVVHRMRSILFDKGKLVINICITVSIE